MVEAEETWPAADRSLDTAPVVFVSYAREDDAFLLPLKIWLEASGIQARGDWCLPAAVPYRERLRELILACHSFLFVISPDSIRSESCLWELEVALEHQKKIVPLVWREAPLELIPEALRDLQWIFLRNESDFEREAVRLSNTIREDLEWAQEHQYWEERAVDWKEGRSSLLHGEELKEAVRWLERAEALGKVPRPTPRQASFIAESRQADKRRTWVLRSAVGAFILFLIGAVGLSLWQLRMTQRANAAAEKNADQATANAQKAVANAKEARRQQKLAEERAEGERQARLRETAAMRRESGALASALAQVSGQDLQALAAAFRGLGSERTGAPLQVVAGLADAVCATHLSLALTGHPEEVTTAAISQDGERVATGDRAGVIQLWEPTTGRPLRTLHRHSQAIRFLTFAPGGQRLLSAGWDGRTILWKVATGEAVGAFPYNGSEENLRFSPDGSRLLIPAEKAGEPDGLGGFREENLFLVDTATGARLLTIQGIPSHSKVVDFSSDGTLLAASSKEGIRIWRTVDGQLVDTLPGHSPRTVMVAFLPESKALFSGGDDNRLQLRDLEKGTTRFEIEVPSYALDRPVLSPDGSHFLLEGGSGDRRKVWDTTTGKLAKELDVPYSHDVSFLGDDRILAVPSLGGEAFVLDFANGKRLASFQNEVSYPNRLALIPRADRAILVTGSGSVRILKASTGELLWSSSAQVPGLKLLASSADGDSVVTIGPRQSPRLWRAWLDPSYGALIGHTAGVYGLAFSPTGDQVATASKDGTKRLWDLQEGREIARVGDAFKPEWWVSYSADARRLVTTGQDDLTRVWDAHTGELIFQVIRGFFAASQPVLSADGSKVARLTSDGLVEIWHVDREDALKRDAKAPDESYRPPGGSVLEVQFAGDRLRVLTWDSKGVVNVWDTGSRTQVARLGARGLGELYTGLFSADAMKVALISSAGTLHLWDLRGNRIRSLGRFVETSTPRPAFSHDGDRIALAADGSVRIWDTRTGQLILTFRLPGRRDTQIAFSPDGRRLATWGDDDDDASVARIWPATIDEFLRTGEKLLRYTPEWKALQSPSQAGAP